MADRRVLLAVAGATLVLQVVPDVFGGYGYFIDELYYIACARRLALGYVDHPPLAPWLLSVHTWLFGESILSIRLLSALAGAATAALAGWLAAFFGGGRWAQAIAGVTVMLSPLSLVLFDFFSMNGLEILLWTTLLAITLVLVRREEPKLWLLFGAVAGIGLLNKHTMVLIGFAIVLGLLLSPARHLLMSRWLLVGGLIAVVVFLPNLVWQIQHGWPSLEFYRNATLLKNLPSPPAKTLLNQFLFVGPVLFPIWSAGLYFLFRRSDELRATGFAYLILLTILVVSQSSRPDRIAGLYPTLFAAGAVWWEGFLSTRAAVLRWAFAGIVIASSLVFAPLFQPWLPPAQTARFAAFLGLDTQIERGEGKRAELPQWLADRFGWEELAQQVQAIYESLSPDERASALVLAPSYGHAGALELLADLPQVLSTHNTYHLWGKEHAGRLSEGPVIVLGWRRDDLESVYREVEQAGIYECDYCMNWRDEMPIYLARQSKLSAAEIERAWESWKHYE